jgi:hypothetical protein
MVFILRINGYLPLTKGKLNQSLAIPSTSSFLTYEPPLRQVYNA